MISAPLFQIIQEAVCNVKFFKREGRCTFFQRKVRADVHRRVIYSRSSVRFSPILYDKQKHRQQGGAFVCGGDGENRTPVRKRFLRNFSGRRRLFTFPYPRASRHARGLGSFMMHGTLKALRTHGPHSSTPLSGPWASRERRSRDYAARRTVLSLFFNL